MYYNETIKILMPASAGRKEFIMYNIYYGDLNRNIGCNPVFGTFDDFTEIVERYDETGRVVCYRREYWDGVRDVQYCRVIDNPLDERNWCYESDEDPDTIEHSAAWYFAMCAKE